MKNVVRIRIKYRKGMSPIILSKQLICELDEESEYLGNEVWCDNE